MATSRFMRFFSRRQTKTQAKILNDGNNSHQSHAKFAFNIKAHLIEKPQTTTVQIKNGLVCTVIFLDGDNVNFEVDRKALGKDLYDKVINHAKLIESDYFGLQFTDTHNVQQWLDSTKLIKKQCKIGPPYTFRFRVKFYASDPRNLREELTRYLFVLQLKDDIRMGKLDCPPGSDVELTALSMQAELGDYTSDEHSIKSISECRFLPDYIHTEEFEQEVLQKWATHRGLTPADCEVQFLSKARWLEMYGVDLHKVTGKDGLEYKLGLTPTGILVFENEVKIGLFIWSKVTRIDFNRSKLTIVVVEDDDNDPRLQRDFVFLFRCNDEKECKHFWKCALEYHVFFRTTSANKLKKGSKSSFTRTGSRFRFSGRTECQTAALATLPNRNTNFERKASHRFSRRASYAIRKKIQEQENLREQEDERVRKLKSEQEAKLEENKKLVEFKSLTNSYASNHDLTSNCKRPSSLSSSQKNLSLSATQRLDHLIQGSSNDLLLKETESNIHSTNLRPTPPVPPRQIKSDDKTTSSLVLIQQSNSINGCSINNNNVNKSKDLSNDFISNNYIMDNHQTLGVQISPQKISGSLTNGNVSRTDKMNSTSNRSTLGNSQSTPYVLKETYFHSEAISNNHPNTHNQSLSIQSLSSTAPVIVTRTLSQSNFRNASSTLVQATNPALGSSQLNPRHSSSSITGFPSNHTQFYHPLTTEL